MPDTHPFTPLAGRQCQDCRAVAYAITLPEGDGWSERQGVALDHDATCPSLARVRESAFRTRRGDTEVLLIPRFMLPGGDDDG